MIDYLSLKKTLSSIEAYSKTQEARHLLLVGDTEAIRMVPKILASILRDPKADPISKLQSVRLSKDCIETFNDDFITAFQYEVLPEIEAIALYKPPNREYSPLYYFSNDPDAYTAKLSNTIVRLSLECIWVWAKWFPIDPDCLKVSCFRITLEKLALLNVQFNTLLYFSKQYVKKLLPECMVPIKVIQELRKIVKLDLQQTYGTGSSSLIIQQRLSQLLAQEMAKDDTQIIFYSDIFKRAYKNAIRSGVTNSNLIKANQEQNSIVLDYMDKKIADNQQALLLNQQIQQLQQGMLSAVEEKRQLQKQLQEQNEVNKQLQMRINILDSRLNQQQNASFNNNNNNNNNILSHNLMTKSNVRYVQTSTQLLQI